MAASNYDACLKKILAYEGGYTNHPSDPGGATNWGITIIDARKYWKSNATPQDVKAMPLSVAKEIYRSKYWNAVRGDDLPAGIDLCTFDPAVNSGVGRGGPWMAVGLGKPWVSYSQLVTDAKASRNPVEAIRAACRKRMSFLRGLRTFSVFGKGWSSRVANVEASAITMSKKAAGVSTAAIIDDHKQTISTTKSKQASETSATGLGAVSGGGGTVGTWQWDILHTSLVAGLALVVLFIAWRVVKSNQLAAAYQAEIDELEKAVVQV